MLDLLRPLAVFSAVAETGSFRAAADRLGLSASVVSHHVTKLEARFDVALLYRSTRQLTLTEAGQALLEHGRQVSDAGFAALDTLQIDQRRPQGRLRVAVPAILEHSRFMTDVALFLQLYPSVELELTFSDKQVDLIGEGFDLAIRAGRLQDSDLMMQRLTTAEDVLCAAPSYLAKAGTPETPEDLADHKLIGVPSKSDRLSFTRRGDASQKQRIQFKPAVRVNTGDAAVALARRGSGIARAPRLLIEDLPKGELIDVLPDWVLPQFDIQAVWPKNVGRRSLTRLFVDHILAEIGGKSAR